MNLRQNFLTVPFYFVKLRFMWLAKVSDLFRSFYVMIITTKGYETKRCVGTRTRNWVNVNVPRKRFKLPVDEHTKNPFSARR